MKIAKQGLTKQLASKLSGSAGVLIGGTLVSQSIMVISSPILLRLYSPSDVGAMFAIIGLLSVITVVASCRYELAIPLALSDDEAVALVVLSLLILGGTATATWFAISVIGQDFFKMVGVAWLSSQNWLIPLGLLAAGIYSIVSYWSIRKKQFAVMAIATAITALTTTAVQLMFYRFGVVGLLVGQVAGQTAGTVALISRAQMWPLLRRSSRVQILQQAKRHRNFPVYSTWEGLVNTASHQVAPVSLAFAFGSGAAGVFAVAHRFMGIPVTLVGLAVGNVFFASVAKQNKEVIRSEFSRTAAKLSLLGMPAIMLLATAAQPAIRLLFGAEWDGVSKLTFWMAPWFYLQLISSPMSLLFSAMERQKDGMIWQVQLFLLRFVAIAIGVASGNAVYTVILFSVASAIAYFVQLVWLSKLAEAGRWEIVVINLHAFAISVVVSSPVWLSKLAFAYSPVAAWMGILSGFAIYAGYALLMLSSNGLLAKSSAALTGRLR